MQGPTPRGCWDNPLIMMLTTPYSMGTLEYSFGTDLFQPISLYQAPSLPAAQPQQLPLTHLPPATAFLSPRAPTVMQYIPKPPTRNHLVSVNNLMSPKIDAKTFNTQKPISPIMFTVLPFLALLNKQCKRLVAWMPPLNVGEALMCQASMNFVSLSLQIAPTRMTHMFALQPPRILPSSAKNGNNSALPKPFGTLERTAFLSQSQSGSNTVFHRQKRQLLSCWKRHLLNVARSSSQKSSLQKSSSNWSLIWKTKASWKMTMAHTVLLLCLQQYPIKNKNIGQSTFGVFVLVTNQLMQLQGHFSFHHNTDNATWDTEQSIYFITMDLFWGYWQVTHHTIHTQGCFPYPPRQERWHAHEHNELPSSLQCQYWYILRTMGILWHMRQATAPASGKSILFQKHCVRQYSWL